MIDTVGEHPQRTIVAVDPGSAKCGIAVVNQNSTVLHRAIVTTESLIRTVRELIATYQPEALFMGNGTGSKPLRRQFESADFGVPIHLVDEYLTSEAARDRYLRTTPVKGWQRLLPHSLRTPRTPYDDYVAVILAERYWKSVL